MTFSRRAAAGCGCDSAGAGAWAEHLLVERARAHDEVVGAPGGGGGALEHLRLIVLGLLPVAVVVLVLAGPGDPRRRGRPPRRAETARRRPRRAIGRCVRRRALGGRARKPSDRAPANRHAEAFGAKHPRESVHMVQPRASDVCDDDANPHPSTSYRVSAVSPVRLEKIAVGRTFLGW